MTISLTLIGTKITDPDGIDPDADLDYELDWTKWLSQIGDSLASVAVVGANCTAYNASIVGNKTRAWVKNAVAGQTAVLTFQIATTATPPRKENRSIYIKVRDK
jgi:hypothetical protein